MSERVTVLVLMLFMLSPSQASAEWQIKPFLGVAFGGSTTFVDPELAAGNPNVVIGGSGVLLGEVFGVEGDFGFAPGFFQTGGKNLVVGSNVTTLTGNFVLALPRHLAEYSLRPYFVGGGGIVHTSIDPAFGVLQVASTLPVIDVGGGVTGFLTNRIGLSWDVRYFRSTGGKDEGIGISIGPEQLSFWRANMAVAIRY